MHATVGQYRIYVGIPVALRTASCFHQRPSDGHSPVEPCVAGGGVGMVSGFGNRPTETQLTEFRSRVKAHIAEHAPAFEAREGHRAPETADQEAQLRTWFAGLFEAGFVGA